MYVVGFFFRFSNFLNLKGLKNLGNLNLISTPNSEIVVLADFPMVPLLVNSSFSPPLKTFLLVKELWKAKPMSSIFECFKSIPKPRENFFFGTNRILASNSLLELFK